MIEIKAKYKVNGKTKYQNEKLWTSLEKRLAYPVAEVAQFLARSIRARRQAGQGPNGPAQTYRATSNGRIWVKPGGEQPQASKYRITTGRLAGWAVYPDIRTYQTLTGKYGKPKTFDATGELWDRLTVKMFTPKKARIYFLGTHKAGIRASRLAKEVDKTEATGLLQPSPAEMLAAKRIVRKRVSDQLLEASSVASDTFATRKQVTALQRRASKLLG